MRFLSKVLVFVILFVPMLRLNGTLAQTSDTHTLPNDIVFIGCKERDCLSNRLVYVPADTLEPVEIYTDEAGGALRAISWSPQGDKLAVWHAYRDEDTLDFSMKTCIITITGESQICFEDTPNADPQYVVYPVTWSDDGEQVYLVVEDDDGVSLVERDVATGETLRTLYQSRQRRPEQIFHANMIWSPDLQYIA